MRKIKFISKLLTLTLTASLLTVSFNNGKTVKAEEKTPGWSSLLMCNTSSAASDDQMNVSKESNSFEGGKLKLSVAGGKLHSTGDNAYLMYLSVSGDFKMTATIDSIKAIDEANPNSAAMIMVKKNDAKATDFSTTQFSLYYKASNQEIKGYERGVTKAQGAGGSTGTVPTVDSIPDKVKLTMEKKDATYQTYFYNKNGEKVSVKKLDDTKNNLGKDVYLGLAVANAEAVFSDISVEDKDGKIIYSSSGEDNKKEPAKISSIINSLPESVVVTQKIELPKTVVALFSDGTKAEVPVKWDALDTSTVGNKEVLGTVEGSSEKAKINVNVISKAIDLSKASTPKITPVILDSNVSEMNVTISNFGDIDSAQYRIDGGAWHEYTGPVAINKNCVINARGVNKDKVAVTNLATYQVKNIVASDKAGKNPIIGVNTVSPTLSVNVAIVNWENAKNKQYRINEGEWKTYGSNPIMVNENCKIEAKSENSEVVKYEVKNIIKGTATDGKIYVSNKGVKDIIVDGKVTAGNKDNPLYFVKDAVLMAKAGDSIYVEGGEYFYDETVKVPANVSGTKEKVIYISSYNGKAEFNFKAQAYDSTSRGFEHYADYWNYKGIVFKNAGDNGMKLEGNYNIIENCEFHHNRDAGLQIGPSGGTEANQSPLKTCYNQVINCDAYYNYDYPVGGNADGFAVKLFPGTGNSFKGCRSWGNSDDGWDCFQSNYPVILENCWTWDNGKKELLGDNPAFNGNGNGFKMGGGDSPGYNYGKHVLKNCIAFDNKVKGFDRNNSMGLITVVNCLSFNNEGANYGFSRPGTAKADEPQNIFKNNVSIPLIKQDGTEGKDVFGNSPVFEKNSWNIGIKAAASDYESLDKKDAAASRQLDGSLPDNGFGKIKSGSKLIDAGAKIEDIRVEDSAGQVIILKATPYNGTAPDLGPVETKIK